MVPFALNVPSKVGTSCVGNPRCIIVEFVVYYRIFCTCLACFRSHSAFTSCEIVEVEAPSGSRPGAAVLKFFDGLQETAGKARRV